MYIEYLLSTPFFYQGTELGRLRRCEVTVSEKTAILIVVDKDSLVDVYLCSHQTSRIDSSYRICIMRAAC